MRPPYLRRLERRRRIKFLAVGFVPIVAWMAFAISAYRFALWAWR